MSAPVRAAFLIPFFASIGLVTGCLSRPTVVPPLGEDAPYEGEDEDTRASIALFSDVAKARAAAQGAKDGGILRGAHAKGHGCPVAKLVPMDDAPGAVRKGLFSQPRAFDATLRFSNAGPTLKADTEREPRGVAIKLHGVPGPKLWSADGGAGDLDLTFVNLPLFPARTVAHYNALVSSRTTYFLARPFLALRTASRIPKDVRTLLDVTYFTIGAVKWGDSAARLRLRPCAPMAPLEAAFDEGGEGGLAAELGAHLAAKGACFVLEAQLQKDAERQPVEDTTVIWDEEETPFLPVARLEIPRQAVAFGATEVPGRGACEALAFNPWRTTAEHRPLGSLNRARKAVYEASARLRKEGK